ncbi:L,D-transpeptidase family protein [uncultured Thiodictyon sp.]|uniref:L,D-transpeptidase family protein n=1 Tax=uncultured Thiodictyon sp. TaxID=1846217 RepID=UPI0025DAE2FD|nr:L,D-transpeptidase family protein [uncultured Thiodictyon sp.]
MKSKAESSGVPGRAAVAGAVALGLGVVTGWVPGAQAETFRYAHPGDSVVGMPFYIKSRKHDTLLDIGRQNQLGYQDMEQANPKVDMWVPGDGREVLVPSMYVLPDTPRSGLVLNRPEMRLYFYPPGKPDEVQSYPISVGREGWSTPLGTYSIAEKIKGPTWTPPASIRAEHAAQGDILPAVVPAGPDNPLGPYAMRLSVPSYLIHGTDKPWGLGMPVSHGCIRMNNEGIIELFPQVPKGTTVTIVDQPYKLGWLGDDLYLEVNVDDKSKLKPARSVIPESVVNTQGLEIDWKAVDRAVAAATGLPQLVGSRRGLADQLYLRMVF